MHDDWAEICKRVGGHGGAHEHEAESPELEVRKVHEELAHGQRIRHRVAAIALDALRHEECLLFGEKRLLGELPGLRGSVGEILDDEPGADGDDLGDQAFDDEDPGPAFEVGETIHLDEAVGEIYKPGLDGE